MKLLVQSYPRLNLAIPAAIAGAWMLALMLAPSFGIAAYGLPIVPLVLIAIGMVFVQASKGSSHATGALLAAVIFFLNLNFRNRDVGFTGLDWQNGAKFAVWVAILMLAAIRWREIVPLFREKALSLVALYACIALASASWSQVPAYSGASAVGLFAYMFLACFIVIDITESAAQRIIVWTLALYIVISLLGGFLDPETTWMPPSVEESAYRFQGFSGHPNVIGQQAGIFITMTLIARRQRFINRVSFWIFLLLGMAAAFESGSRTTLAAVILAWGLVAIRGSRYCREITLFIIAGLTVFCLAASIGALRDLDEFLAGFSRTGTTSEIFTLTGRTEIWQVAWEYILQKPFLGWGYNGTEDLLGRSMRSTFYGNAVNVHNMLLQCLLSVGFIGTMIAIGYLGLMIVRYFTNPDPTRDQIIALLLINGLGEAEIFTTPVLFTLMVYWAIAREAVKENPVRQAQKAQTRLFLQLDKS